jgi:beta-galactosidase
MPDSPRPRLDSSVLLHGADYFPEQWGESTWAEDASLMDEVRLNLVTLGVAAWNELEPSEGNFEFGWLDKTFESMKARGRMVCLATPSTAPPAWLSAKYPEILRTGPDRVRMLPGNRGNFCWTSPVYREKVATINDRLAQRYGKHGALKLWHVGNDYGGGCYCDLCRQAFIGWLKAKFKDDLEALNSAYRTRIWGHRFSDWNQLQIPGGPHGESSIQGLSIDFYRFNTDQIIDFFLHEADPIRKGSPNVPLTTNLQGMVGDLDPWKLAPHLDVIGWDSYPQFRDKPMDARAWAMAGMSHDLMRSLSGSKPWLLLECSPSSAHWYPYMSLKPPTMHLFETLQAVAHGSDSVMYYQWRASRAGEEMMHGSVVSTGQGGRSRVFRDVAEVGAALETLSELAGSTSKAEAAVIYDRESRWALELSDGPVQSSKRYTETCLDHYWGLWESGITTDIINQDADLSGYKLVLAPMLYMLKPGTAERFRSYVENGGTLVCTYLTGWVDENDLVFEDGIFSPLSDLFGVRSEELDVLYPGTHARIVLPRGAAHGVEGSFQARDFVELVHATDTHVSATYALAWYEGKPAVTRKKVGSGEAIYIGARLENDFTEPFLVALCASLGISRNYPVSVPSGVTVQKRVLGSDEYLFVMNGSEATAHVPSPESPYVEMLSGRPVTHGLTLLAHGIAVLRKG